MGPEDALGRMAGAGEEGVEDMTVIREKKRICKPDTGHDWIGQGWFAHNITEGYVGHSWTCSICDIDTTTYEEQVESRSGGFYGKTVKPFLVPESDEFKSYREKYLVY